MISFYAMVYDNLHCVKTEKYKKETMASNILAYMCASRVKEKAIYRSKCMFLRSELIELEEV